MKKELKQFILCPKCKTGQMVHVNDHYYCNTDNRICNFMIRSDHFGARMTKSMMVELIKKRYLEPMFIGLVPFPKKSPVNGFIVLSPKNDVEFVFSNLLNITPCPKCKTEKVIMKYSEKNDRLFYSCRDYKNCGFSLPYIFRNKPFRFKDIIKLCEFETVSKTYISKKDKKYTLNVFLDKAFKVSTKI